ncbi:MAG: SGNH/GDSL hydrolase family protein [Nocardioidaceae bacterium]
MRSAYVHAALASAATLLLAAAPTATADPPDDPPGNARAYGEYVALGDSYTAGPLIPEIRNDPLGCVRSTHNYPARLASYLDVGTYVDASCSGAKTKHLRKEQSTSAGTNAPQLDALSKHTELVSLGIGGNDFGLFGSLIAKCPELAKKNPDGAPCRKWFNRTGTDVKKRDAQRIGDHVERGIRLIRDRAPHADIVVVGYLRIVPVDGDYCRKVIPFARGDYRWVNNVERTLNKSIRGAAHRQDATFVHMFPVSRGHTACDRRKAWVNGQYTDLLRAASYHPFRKGMRGIARQSYRELTGEESPKAAARPYAGRTLAPKDLDTYPNLMRALTSGQP